ncbi:beta-propeller domain-containing protein [Dactylosporangium sp. CA-139066]|uniref:beta-propeller domain-containing protein n=1 Tax=Dactylosporangium sp. CA-139066 TaxID=3239930 RepID=UPI003D8F81C2
MLLLLAGCTAERAPSGPSTSAGDAPAPAPALRLVAYDSCADLLTSLRKATREAVTPWGLGGPPVDYRTLNDGAATKASVPEAAARTGGSDQAYSGTNTHEAGVDEPDLVKTDGKRIVTVTGDGALTVVDAASRKVTGTVPVGSGGELLLSGDRALVLGYGRVEGGPLLTLVDLAGPPKIVGSYHMDGSLVDARQVGSVARIVIRSSPRIDFPQPGPAGIQEGEGLEDNRAAVDAAPIEAWLPRWTSVDAAGKRTDGHVDCGALSLPDTYSGTSVLTVATFDLAAPALGSGDPVAIAADGGIVYANGPSLYVGNDQRWRTYAPMGKRAGSVAPVPQRTQLFKFTIAGAAKPRYVAAGEVPGWLLNQYSLSEWDGRLRVATTANDASAVYVLEQRGGALAEAGKVGGLGKGEKIYSVRFIGTAGYVVTFRQTDPLYTLDLSDPSAPRAVGELKITGYSAYLHPAGTGRLIGVGQEANEKGRVQGLQVSLFDVHDMAAPGRLSQFQVPGTASAAEWDPHAFLYWPATGQLVLPMTRSGALVLSVGDKAIAKTGTITHPGSQYTMIERSLVIGGTLWTMSAAGLQANDLSTLAQQAWLPF